MAVTKHAKKLNMEQGVAEHTEVDARADDARAESLKEKEMIPARGPQTKIHPEGKGP